METDRKINSSQRKSPTQNLLSWVPFVKYLSILALLCCALYAAVGFIIYKLTRPAITLWSSDPLDYTNTGAIGDTIGGISALVVGVIAAGLTFLSFYMQYVANEIAQKQIVSNSKTQRISEFESRLSLLIKSNREIVAGMRIKNLTNDKTMRYLYDEFRVVFELAQSTYGEFLTAKQLMNAAYATFYFGVGKHSSLSASELFNDNKAADAVANMMKIRQDIWELNAKKKERNEIYSTDSFLGFPYMPFCGHQIRLGHYFRSLFHVLKYASVESKKLGIEDGLYELIKPLRTQMSTFEQILILINSNTVFGEKLMASGYIETFKLTKNIPAPMIRFIHPFHNPVAQNDLEWSHIQRRIDEIFPQSA